MIEFSSTYVGLLLKFYNIKHTKSNMPNVSVADHICKTFLSFDFCCSYLLSAIWHNRVFNKFQSSHEN